MRKKEAGRRPDRVAALTAQVESLTARLAALEGAPAPSDNGNVHEKAPQSRRDLLKMAGAAAAGAAGSILLGGVPAAAADGDPMTLGHVNDEATVTDLIPSTGTTPTPMFQATGQGVVRQVVSPTVSAT